MVGGFELYQARIHALQSHFESVNHALESLHNVAHPPDCEGASGQDETQVQQRSVFEQEVHLSPRFEYTNQGDHALCGSELAPHFDQEHARANNRVGSAQEPGVGQPLQIRQENL